MEFLNFLWPIVLITVGNCFYNVCAKSTPLDADAYLSMAVSYLTGGIISFVIFCFTRPVSTFNLEILKLKWTAPLLGCSIVALEVGYIYAYRAGWKINTASLVTNIALAVMLLFIGWIFYGEAMTLRKSIGIGICSIGLIFLIK